VYAIESDVAYEETFLLLDAVVDALPFAATAVVMPVNRGVLLAADGRSVESVLEMMEEAFSALQNNPWPISGTALTRSDGQWIKLNADEALGPMAHAVESLGLASTYSAQQTALQEHYEKSGKDVFVATFDLRKRGDSLATLYSYCTWTDGVSSLLPKSDVIAFVRGDLEQPEVLFVDWDAMHPICGHLLKSTSEDPPRFAVDAFPTNEQWTLLLPLDHTNR
jgi:hypothetical protein